MRDNVRPKSDRVFTQTMQDALTALRDRANFPSHDSVGYSPGQDRSNSNDNK